MLSLKAFAKINLYLRVLGVRQDGYHELETLFERISLCDEITLSPCGQGIQLEVEGSDLPSGPENLAYRAADQFRQHFGIQQGVRIKLTKKIPIAAGLGGGSSDAATVLLGLNDLFKVNAEKEELLRLGTGLGADVPFFLLETRRAVGKGRGDQLEEEPSADACFYLLATPLVSVLTKDVYKSWDKLKRLTPRSKNDSITVHLRVPPQQWSNDLEAVVVWEYQQVREFADQLRRLGLSQVRLSGSGPTFFAGFGDQLEAEHWARRVSSSIKNCQVHSVQGH